MGYIPRPLLTNRFTEAIDIALVAHDAQVPRGTRIPSLVIEHDASEMVVELRHAIAAIPGCEAFGHGLNLGCGGAVGRRGVEADCTG